MAVEKGYFGQIAETTSSVFEGLSLTLKHLFAARNSRKQQFVQAANYFNHDTEVGIVTLQYPAFKLPVPAIGRYELDCVIEDCIVCDKCAKICPVNCIDIVGIKASEVIGETSDGTNKRIHAAKFDIDMAKCCFCGLCTTVCPTECLTMTNEYDHTTFTVDEMNFSFANMSIADIAQAQVNLEADKLAKETAKAAALAAKQAEVMPVSEIKQMEVTAKPKFSAFKKKEPVAEATEAIEVPKEPVAPVDLDEVPKPKATFKPFKKKEVEPIGGTEPEIDRVIPTPNPILEPELPAIQEELPKPKATFKPFKKKENTSTTENPNSDK